MIKLLQGYHLTQTERKHLNHLHDNHYLNTGFFKGKVTRKVYEITKINEKCFDVLIWRERKNFEGQRIKGKFQIEFNN